MWSGSQGNLLLIQGAPMIKKLLYLAISIGILIPSGVSASIFLVEYFADPTTPQNHHLFGGSFQPGKKIFDMTIEATNGPGGVIADSPGELHVQAFGGASFGEVTGFNYYDFGFSGQHAVAAAVLSTLTNYNFDFNDADRSGDYSVDIGSGQFLSYAVEHAPSQLSGGPPLVYFAGGFLLDLSPILHQDLAIIDGGLITGDLYMREISPVPAPTPIWLFGIALVGLVGFSNRRKAA